ncbi:MAG: hypothetical protein JWR20_1762 [Marmoricola sp.]|nr:hypothetical protein [Marmoricola sp.]
MVEPLRPATAAGVSRRGVLAGAGGLAAAPLLVGCSLGEVGQAVRRGSGPAPTPTPDVRVATRALASVRAAREQVSATTARYPGLAGTLAPLLAVHRAHEASLVDAVPRGAASPTSSAASPTASPSTGATPTGTPAPTAPTAPTVPRTRARALAAVVALEDRLHADLDGLAMRAQSGDFARLLAAMGAALAQRRAGLTG